MSLARFVPLLQGFLLDRLLNSNTIMSRKSKVGVFLLITSAVCFFTALVFAIIAAYQWLLANYPADTAALLAASFVLALSAIFAITALVLLNQKRSRFQDMKSELTDQITALYDAVAEEMDDPVRNHPKTALAVATLAGFFLANRL